MPRLLIFEPAFRRIEQALEARPDVEPAIVDRAGAVSIAGRPVAIEAAAPDIAWFSGDLYRQPAAPAFARAVLAAPALKWLQTASAGVDNAFFARVVAGGARLTTSHGQAVGMADYVLAGVLDHFQRGPERRAAQARGEWLGLPFREVSGSTWLVIGFGAIGQGVAVRARAFGARIVGVRRDQTPHPLADAIASLTDLPRLLPEADVVALTLPLTEATRHLADAAFFAAMKPGSVLVNVGRGKVVDEAALIAALDRGAPAHAVLDVFETEPLPADSPLWDRPDVSVTAHTSGVTGAQDGRNQALFLDNLDRYLSGRPLLNAARAEDLMALK